MSEAMAVGCLQGLQEANYRIPQDLAIVTAGDSRWVEYVRPTLTAVRVPMYRVAQRATEILLAAVEGEELIVHETLGTEFVIRGSCR